MFSLVINDEIRKRCTNITLMPLAAPLRPELGKDTRMVVFDRYLIFYTVEANNVRIERILHWHPLAASCGPDAAGWPASTS